MSSNLNYKQATNVERRTWDRDEYEKKAQARAQDEPPKAGDKRPLLADEEKEEFRPAAPGAAGPERSKRAFLKARQEKVDIDSKVGSTEIVSVEAVAKTKIDVTGSVKVCSFYFILKPYMHAYPLFYNLTFCCLELKDGVTKTGVGWHCKVCDCFLKDSHTYLDHINGKKHQRNLGYSMKVEKSTADQVKERLAQLAKEREKNNKIEVETTDYEDVIKAKDEEAFKRKAERARKREERKKRFQEKEETVEEEEEAAAAEEIHPDMAAIMGFAGFGGGNKTT